MFSFFSKHRECTNDYLFKAIVREARAFGGRLFGGRDHSTVEDSFEIGVVLGRVGIAGHVGV